MTSIDIEAAASAGGFDEILSPSQQPQRNTALSNKLSNVLATSFADSEIREALRELDERHVQNTAETRRRLRTDIQKEVIDCNGDIVRDFGLVALRLKRIGATIASLNECCEEMKKHISAAQRETAPILDEASTLVTQKEETETKQQLLTAFNKHFMLTEEEMDILTASSEPVDERYFTLLTRLKRIHADCEVLLGDNQQLGLELLDKSSKQLDSAFQKLFRWIQREFKTLDLENPQMNATIRRALRVLAERPALFESCLDFFAEARERNLSDAFYTALTGFSAAPENRASRPMDAHAHDALRFAGDMLAWTHSATVSEREALEVLFISEGDEMAKGIQAGLESEPWRKPEGAPEFDGKLALAQLVNRDLAGVARALRQRVEQTIRADDDAVLAYKIGNLVDFYRLTFERLLGSDPAASPILATLVARQESARAQFSTLMHDHASAIPADAAGDPPPDLSPPEFLLEALERLSQIAKSHDGSFVDASTRASAFSPTLELALDPFLTACLPSFDDSPEPALPDPAGSVFALNVLRAVLHTLDPFDFATPRIETLRAARRALSDRLAAHQHRAFQARSGISHLISALEPLDSQDPSDLARVPELPQCRPAALGQASQKLDAWLPEALVEAQEELRHLVDKTIAEDVTAEAAGRFCEDFDAVEEILVAADEISWGEGKTGEDDEEEEGRRLRDLFPRTSAEIRVLLS
jgi:conserved oligomeric Golgi complex subunit 6